MLPARNGATRVSQGSQHICLGCRLEAQRQLRHRSAFDAQGTIGRRSTRALINGNTPTTVNSSRSTASVPNARGNAPPDCQYDQGIGRHRYQWFGPGSTARETLLSPLSPRQTIRPERVAQDTWCNGPERVQHRRYGSATTRTIRADKVYLETGMKTCFPRGERFQVTSDGIDAARSSPLLCTQSSASLAMQRLGSHLEDVRECPADMMVGGMKRGVQRTKRKLEGVDVTSERSFEQKQASPFRSLGNLPVTREQYKKARYLRHTAQSSLAVRNPDGIRAVVWYNAGSTAVKGRAYHASHRTRQQAAAALESPPPPTPDIVGVPPQRRENPTGIRAQLRRWQELHGHKANLNDDVDLDDEPDLEFSNNLVRLPSEKNAFARSQAEQDEDEREAMAHFMQAPGEEPSSSDANARFLKMGDLVEIENIKSEHESIVAVFVRRIGSMAQFYTMQGRWIHMGEKQIQYSIPGWVPAEMVEPILQYLPDPEEVENNLEALLEEAYIKDLSVPRHVAAPLVSRMVRFHEEVHEIYRKNARTLDSAHRLLAHESDLRYGSLVSAASTLLKMPANELPVTALFAVRQALANAGFAFNIDRRSHRLTGYLQIRSKEQVKMVDEVRKWLREWQDDLAIRSTLNDEQRKRHRPKKGAYYVYRFLEKARQIVLRSRENRDPTPYGSIGPSKVHLPITPDQDCVRVTREEMFSDQDTELVRFLEAWCLSNMFMSLPRLEALPPLLLQATGLYEGYPLKTSTGMLLLQELGTIMPYENRVRFDQHLLLPSSQHSKPLQNLMSSLLDMGGKHNFVDSMKDLRHDWEGLPVYCIDDADAHEIDDGLSVEPAAMSDHGPAEWWVHVHIANPTAFFNRDHPLAKMARHMGESIYMPERTYMMLPRWATQRHFSLGQDRPCLTFSARMDEEGNTLEHKITPATMRNVFRLTHDEVADLMGVKSGDQFPEKVLTVGGQPPPPRERKSRMEDIKPEHVEQLQWLNHLAIKRKDIRQGAGGIFFDAHKPGVQVWQSWKGPGLAWDHPFRKGWRQVEGDPVIQLRTKGFVNWFAPLNDAVDILVREHMLLACEVAATWCEERQIPAIFRGSVRKPDKMDSQRFWDEVIGPAMQKNPGKEWPMHLGMQYLETFGNTVLSTRPFKHAIIGMEKYGKVTSPLRRYGDMITHWQIEAALREEARTGKSLVTDERETDRRFLPFSSQVLETIIVGLQPRESIIMKSKKYAEDFWMMQLVFRLHHVGMDHPSNQHPATTPLPLRTVPAASLAPEALPDFARPGAAAPSNTSIPDINLRLCHAYIHGATKGFDKRLAIGCMVMELNLPAAMTRPEKLGMGELKQGDVWECTISEVDVYRRMVFLRPVRLVERVDEGMRGVDQ